ncbi:unnamed protein product [Brachionus calyciflorus]|uniref:Uncharacterized protein n=1 Tax=Brachionus calyciflorus TaxID=104777 RepID=A0A813R492_9BILA|nr:unnamed protein product [Brachionus calyciflorus]
MNVSSALSTKSLRQTSNFNSSRKTRNSPANRTTKSLIQTSPLDNIEIEYIKNLQQQVYFLELECNYLRQQLNLNGLETSLKYDKKSQELKNEMLSMHLEKTSLEKSLIEENEHKENVLKVLEQTEKTFHKERELLLKEISLLKNQILSFEESLVSKNVEITKLKENLSKHHIESSDSVNNLAKIEIQLENVRRDNLQLRAELNDSRSLLISRDNLIKELQHQLSDPSLRKSNLTELKSSLNNISLKLSMTNEALNKESVTSKQLQDENVRLQLELDSLKSKINELSRENSRLSSSLEISLKQNESDLILAKKNSDLAKLNLEKLQTELDNEKIISNSLRTQVEQFKLQERLENKSQANLKTRIKDLENSLKTFEASNEKNVKNLQEQLRNKERELSAEKSKWSQDYNQLITINKSLESKLEKINIDKDDELNRYRLNFESSKSKLSQLQNKLDEMDLILANEKNNSRTLQMKIDNYGRQEQIEQNLIGSLKERIAELESQINEFIEIKEPDWSNKLSEANLKVTFLEEEKLRLKSDIDLLNQRIKEIDRLKNLEDLIHSQKWSELGQLADSMKNLSHVMTTSTNSNLRMTMEEY